MPIGVLNEDQKEAASKKLASCLSQIFDEMEIPLEAQLMAAHLGYKNARRYAGLQETRDGVRDVLRNEFNLDGNHSTEERVLIADMLAVWEAAKSFSDKEIELKAEKKVDGVLRPTPDPEHQAMRKSYESAWGKLQDKEVPGKYFLQAKCEQVVENEPRVESLSDVTSKLDGEENYMTAGVDEKGRVLVRKGGSAQARMPKDSEEYRTRIRLVGNGWLFAKTKHPHKSWLQGLSPQDFEKHVDYIVGDKVMKLKATDSEGSDDTYLHPSFEQVMVYCFEVRKRAYELVRDDGFSMKEALVAARKDEEVKNLHLIVPTLINTRNADKKRKWSQAYQWTDTWNNNNDSQLSNKQRKKEYWEKKSKLKYNTQDGRPICFAFNNAEGCDGQCNRVHICQICLSPDHGRHACPRKPSEDVGKGKGKGKQKGKQGKGGKGGKHK